MGDVKGGDLSGGGQPRRWFRPWGAGRAAKAAAASIPLPTPESPRCVIAPPVTNVVSVVSPGMSPSAVRACIF